MQMRLKIMSMTIAAVVLAGAGAQQTRDDGGAVRFQAMLQQLTSEKTQLVAENAKLKADLEKVNAEAKRLRDTQAGLERRLGQSESSLSQVSAMNTRNTGAIEQLRAREAEIVAEFRKLADTLRTTELERNELRASLASRDSALNQCVTANQKMFDTGNEVLDRYEEKSCFSSMRENEPFTRIRRVRLENLVDEYRWALDDHKLPASSAPTPAQ